MKRILILAAGLHYTRVIRILKDAGYWILALDRDGAAPGFDYADKAECIDIIDERAVLESARRNKVDAIMPLNDFGVRSAAYVASELGFVGLKRETAFLASDKGAMRECWRAFGLKMPSFTIIQKGGSLKHTIDSIGFPCVVKPTDCGGGGRGVTIANNEQELQESYEVASAFAKNGRIIVEEFIEGTEITVEALTYKGETTVLAMSDKVKPEVRSHVATSLNYPASISDECYAQIECLVKKAVEAIGLQDGASHTEVIVARNGAYLIEIGARGGGGCVFHTCVELTSGICMPLENAKILCGQVPSLVKKDVGGTCYRFFQAKPGLLMDVEGVDEACMYPNVVDLCITKKCGEEVKPLLNSLERVGYIVTRGKTREDAMHHASAVESMIIFNIK